jgi:hypothetical protein
VACHIVDEFAAVGSQASDRVVDAFNSQHNAPESQRIRRCNRRFDLDQFGIAKFRPFQPPVPISGPHNNDIDLNIFNPVPAVHPARSHSPAVAKQSTSPDLPLILYQSSDPN